MSAQYTRLLIYFILTMGVILTGILLISFVETQKAKQEIQYARDDIKNASDQINTTQMTVNQTQLFITQSKYEDKAREKQNHINMLERSNQTRTIMNNTQDLLEVHHNGLVNLYKDFQKAIELQNKEISEAQKQNDNIMDTLVKIHAGMMDDTKDTNEQVSKYGPENNALAKAILEKLGVNSTEILEKEVYSNQTLKEMITP